MVQTRVIPCLLLRNRGLVKTVKFKNPTYLGDPINVVKIFNDKEVDELVFLDITATVERKGPPFKLLSEIASECFMPLAYGGGIRTLEDIRTILSVGVEKIAINSYAVENPNFIRAVADLFGSQSIVVSIDVKKSLFGKYELFSHSGTKKTGLDPIKFAVEMERLGAGELLLNSIDRDGMMQGYDLELIKKVADSVNIPVVACGGAHTINDLGDAVKKGGASAVAAGSMFVFHGPHRAVLISYPTPQELKTVFAESQER
jgi:imidazole glycerol-phosphate synthase subunit HisF